MTDSKIILELSRKNLFGWEPKKSVRTVDYLIYRQEQGDVLPLVDVLMINNETFMLDFNQKHKAGHGKGGHNRSISQYIGSNSVNCRLRGTLSQPMFEGMVRRYSLIDIKNIILSNDSAVSHGESFEYRRENDANYRKEYPYDERAHSLVYKIWNS